MHDATSMLSVMGLSLCLIAGGQLGPPAGPWQAAPDSPSGSDASTPPPDSAALVPTGEPREVAEAPPVATDGKRFGFTGGGESLALTVGLFATPSWFILLEEDEGAWLGGSNLFLAAIVGLSPRNDERDTPWPLGSRLAFLGGMSGLAAYEIVHDEDLTDGELFWTNLAGVTLTLLVTDLLFQRAR